MTIHFLSTESHPNTLCHSLQPPLLHLFTSKSSRKRYGLLFPHLISCILSFIFVSICVGILIFVMGLFRCFWIVLVWIIKGIVPMQTCFGWWFHIFSSVCFLEMIWLPDLYWCTITCWFLLPILLDPNSCGSFVLSDFYLWFISFEVSVCYVI